MARKQILDRAVESAKGKEPMVDGLIEVEATASVHEDGITYSPGSKFRTTPERAQSLVNGGNVKILS